MAKNIGNHTYILKKCKALRRRQSLRKKPSVLKTTADGRFTLAQAAQYEEAYTSILHALQYVHWIPEYRALEGSLFVYLHKPNSAIQHFQSAIQHEPVTPWFHAGLAEAYAANYNISMAYVESRRAAELFPQKLLYQKRVQEIRTVFNATM